MSDIPSLASDPRLDESCCLSRCVCLCCSCQIAARLKQETFRSSSCFAFNHDANNASVRACRSSAVSFCSHWLFWRSSFRCFRNASSFCAFQALLVNVNMEREKTSKTCSDSCHFRSYRLFAAEAERICEDVLPGAELRGLDCARPTLREMSAQT